MDTYSQYSRGTPDPAPLSRVSTRDRDEYRSADQYRERRRSPHPGKCSLTLARQASAPLTSTRKTAAVSATTTATAETAAALVRLLRLTVISRIVFHVTITTAVTMTVATAAAPLPIAWARQSSIVTFPTNQTRHHSHITPCKTR